MRYIEERPGFPGALRTSGGYGGPFRGPPSLLLLDHQMGAAVLRPARLAVLGALRLFLAVRDDRDAPGLHALRGEVVLRGLRAALAEREVVRHAAPVAAVPLDHAVVLRVAPSALRR